VDQTLVAEERIAFLDLAAMHDEVRGELDAAWQAVNGQNAFVGGPWLAQFEQEWAAYCGRAYCVGVGNGTDALIIALRAAGIGRGHEVVVPANTFIATAEAVLAVGAQVVFTDVDPSTLLMTAAHLEAAVTPRTAAVIPVHLYGQPVAMGDLCSVAKRHGLLVVEDAAQAHGATWRGARAGSFGDMAAFSFYPGKNLGALGDGGAIVTDDPALAFAARALGNHGATAERRYVHQLVGGNSRLDGLQAALLSVKLRRLDAWNEARARVACSYDARLHSVARVIPVRVAEGARSSNHLYVVRVPARAQVQAALLAQGIETGIHYPIPCHLQEPYRTDATVRLPVAEEAAGEILSLPMGPQLTQAQVARVCDALEQAVGHD
jgi:dTDP-4-amino-4,6-dideoxygalactose transaminase